MNLIKKLFNYLKNLFKKKDKSVPLVHTIPKSESELEPIKSERTFKDKLIEIHYQKLRRKRKIRNKIAKFSKRKNRC